MCGGGGGGGEGGIISVKMTVQVNNGICEQTQSVNTTFQICRKLNFPPMLRATTAHAHSTLCPYYIDSSSLWANASYRC